MHRSPRVRALVCALVLAFAAVPLAAAAPPATTITASGVFGSLPVVAFDGTEALSSLFRYDADVVTDSTHPIVFSSTLGTEVTVTLTRGQTTRQFSGMCSRISESDTASGATYRLELVPKLALLALNEDSRIFQDVSVPDIVSRVLASHGIEFQLALTRSYDARNFVVQYRESDFNFVSRLMEEEGIYYFFTHGPGGHHMVVADSAASAPALAAVANFVPATHGPDIEGVFTWQKSQELRPGKVTLADFNFLLPGNHVEAASTIAPSVVVGSITHQLALPATTGVEVYDYPGGYAKRYDGDGDVQKIFAANVRAAAIRMEELASTAIAIDGSGNLPSFEAGVKFTLAQHPNGNGQYLVTSVHHTVNLSQSSKADYQNTFTSMPSALAFRPRRVSPPPAIGTQTATVVGPAGEVIYTDKYGRVKVQFHWDRQGKNDQNSSAWIRVGSLHQGEENGFTVAPAIGSEVVIAFTDGDPDQPIIVGSVYNPERPAPCPGCPVP